MVDMKDILKVSLIAGIIAGFAMFGGLWRATNDWFSILTGFIGGIICFFAFFIWLTNNVRKHKKLLLKYGDSVLFSVRVNLYGDNNKILNGVLLLTEKGLFFEMTNRNKLKIEYPLHQIAKIDYNIIQGHTNGLCVFMKDGTTGRFAMTKKDYEFINDKMDTIHP